MGILDILIFFVFVITVVGGGLWMSRGEETHSEHGAQDYFLAGRGLTWWLVGFSLIAANISTEQFVGMSGRAADWLGMAIASYEWMAAVTLVVVAFVFLPTFLRSGIYTIPEFLEYRYNAFARTVMAITTLIILVGVPTASVIYSGAKVISVGFQDTTVLGLDLGNITAGCWIIGLLAAAYVFVGGLKACAWTDLVWGSALILGGIVIAYLAFQALGMADPEMLVTTAAGAGVTVQDLEGSGGIARFWTLNQGGLPEGKLHMVRQASDPEIPWTALVVGLWIPNFFYWGLNQYITQRTLGSKSLAEGQKGVIFAAFLKLIIPFVVVIPGILAFNLFNAQLQSEAQRKNESVLADFEAKTDHVFQFTTSFAELNPDIATAMFTYNQTKVDVKLEGVKDADPTAVMSKQNDQLIAAARAKANVDSDYGTKVAANLVGYDYDAAFPTLLRQLLPEGIGLKGFVFAAIFGAVVSSLASMLNSASTIATMDLYYKVKKDASQYELVTVGRICTVIFVLIAIVIAPHLDKFGGIFTYIQEFQGFVSPGILSIFLFGLLIHRAPRYVGTVGLLLNPVLYGLFKFSPAIFGDSNPAILNWIASESFLNRMAMCFGIILAVLAILTLLNPLKKPVDLPVNENMNLESSKGAKICGIGVVILTVILYIIFW